ncbi:YraN family protein [Pusillimonas caeni]|uniref:YraN family protein n=1 Tax=Pusillimonas caeni TaxID=1348472 RepID=UPI000E59F5A7|nr:YraN family protein [Pusillimonas caeni]TFL15518.1 YraN family protein [Pusillimonas caeni]
MLDDTSDPFTLARTAQRAAIRRRRRALRRKAAATAPEGHETPHLSPTQRLGRQAEERARRHIEAAGAQVLQQNLLCRSGEIDLVCVDGGVLAFIEVRHRHSARFGGAAASVDHSKRERLVQAATWFLPRLARRYFGGRTPPCRFDVIAIDGAELTWLRGVFDAPR